MFQKLIVFSLALLCIAIIPAAPLHAQANSFKQTNLVSNTAGLAAKMDTNLINPWGIAFLPGNPPSPFWISDNNAGVSTLYDNTGTPSGVFSIPPPKGSSALATPTGIVANDTNGFQVTAQGITGPSFFIFSTEDGTISGWNGTGSAAILAVDNSMGGIGAVYKGLALITNSAGNNFLLASNFRSAQVDIFDAKFATGNFPGPGSFSDPNLPAGFAPFGIHVINNQVFITYAMQDAAKHDPVNAPGNGLINVFDMNGNLLTPQHLISTGGALNSPWGVALAPQSFGAFSGALLVGNFGDGLINAYTFPAGQFIASLQDTNGQPIRNLSLWDMLFSTGADNNPNTLFFDAGLADESAGLFATLEATPVVAAPDFDLTPQGQSSATVTAGKPAIYMISVGNFSAFNTAVALSCSALPANTTCSFSSSTATPGTMVTVTINTQPTAAHSGIGMSQGSGSGSGSGTGSGTGGGMGMGGSMGTGSGTGSGMGMGSAMQMNMGPATLLLPFSALGFGLFGLLFAAPTKNRAPRRKSRHNKFLGALGLLLALSALLTAACCGGNGSTTVMNNHNPGTPKGTFTVFVNGQAGTHFHSTPVILTVN